MHFRFIQKFTGKCMFKALLKTCCTYICTTSKTCCLYILWVFKKWDDIVPELYSLITQWWVTPPEGIRIKEFGKLFCGIKIRNPGLGTEIQLMESWISLSFKFRLKGNRNWVPGTDRNPSEDSLGFTYMKRMIFWNCWEAKWQVLP